MAVGQSCQSRAIGENGLGELGRRERRALLRQAQDLAMEASAMILAQSSVETGVDGVDDALRESLTLQQPRAMPLERLRTLAIGHVT